MSIGDLPLISTGRELHYFADSKKFYISPPPQKKVGFSLSFKKEGTLWSFETYIQAAP